MQDYALVQNDGNSNPYEQVIIPAVSLTQNIIDVLLHATGLTKDEAKTVVYWAIATNGLDVLECFTLLLIHGQPATGKSTILKIIDKLTDAKFISITSSAEFRDMLCAYHVVLIEEADDVNEKSLLKRYSKQAASVNLKHKTEQGVFLSQASKLYGATAMHRRYHLEDLALQSRTIVIQTKRSDKQFSNITLEKSLKNECRTIWEQAWKQHGDYNPSGRTGANWRPLVIVAKYLNDNEWLKYAAKQQELANSVLKEDQDFEPEQVVKFALEDLKEQWQIKGVLYLFEIIEYLSSNYMWKPTPKKLAKLLREQGYMVKHHKYGFGIEWTQKPDNGDL